MLKSILNNPFVKIGEGIGHPGIVLGILIAISASMWLVESPDAWVFALLSGLRYLLGGIGLFIAIGGAAKYWRKYL